MSRSSVARSRPRVRNAFAALVVLGGIPLWTTCGGDGATAPVPVASVSVTGPGTMRVGDSVVFAAVALDGQGRKLSGRSVSWFSSSPAVAQVSVTGVVHGIASGTVQITGSSEGKSAQASLTVLPPVDTRAVFGVSVAPSFDVRVTGQSVTLTATAFDSAGMLITGRPVAWSSSDTTIARVSAAGVVSAVGPGLPRIFARVDTTTGWIHEYVLARAVSIKVLPDTDTVFVGTATRLRAVVRGVAGDTLARVVQWWTLDTTLVRVGPDGLVTGVGIGTAGVWGSVDAVLAVAHVVVRTGPVDTVVLSRNPAPPLFAGDTVTLSATPVGRGSGLPDRSISWASSDTSVFTISASGLVLARKAGRAVAIAISEGVSARDTVIVDRVPATLRISADSLALVLNVPWPVAAILTDSGGAVLRARPVLWTTSNPTIVALDNNAGNPAGTVFLDPRIPGSATVSASLRGATAAIPIRVSAASEALVRFTAAPASLTAGGPPVADSATLVGGYDGRALTLRSTDTTVLAISPTSGTLTAPVPFQIFPRRTGTALITAQAGGTSLSFSIRVFTPLVRVFRITPRTPVLTVGQQESLAVSIIDSSGVARSNPVTWTSSDSSRVSVTSRGVIAAVSAGVAIITAASEAGRDSLTITAQSPASLRIAAFAPDTLRPGDTVVVRGTSFATVPAGNAVSLADVATQVLFASDTQLVLVLPPAGAFGCPATQSAHLTVAAGGALADTTATLQVPRSLTAPALGNAVVLSGPEAACTQIYGTGPAYYELSVSSAAATAAGATTVQVRTDAPDVTLALRAGPDITGVGGAAPAATWPASRARATGPGTLEAKGDAPRRLLQRFNHAFARRARGWMVPGTNVVAAPASYDPKIEGAVGSYRVPLIDLTNYCTNYTRVTARTVYAGSHVLVLEDVNAPLARQMDSQLRTQGLEFDQGMYGILRTTFGDPLAMDASLANVGRVIVLYSPVVNEQYGGGAFVVGCDAAPVSVAPSSNEAPMIYASVPTNPALDFSSGETIASWRRELRANLMYVATALTTFVTRIATGAPPEEPWLADAEGWTGVELWTRGVYGTLWKGGAGYDASIYCDVRPTTDVCRDRPYALYEAFVRLFIYERYHEKYSPLGPVDASDSAFFASSGAAWWFLRWVVDQYGADESAFLLALATDPSRTGVANVVAHAGRPWGEMVTDWSLMSAKDRLPPVALLRPQLAEPTWDLKSIFANMATDFPAYFGGEMPPLPRVTPIPLAPITADIAGGSAIIVELYGVFGDPPLRLRVTGAGGVPLPSTVRVELTRIQ
jgi:uncharacterized protein YjdB